VDHYADAVFSERGRCWRPTHCEEPVRWRGRHRLIGGKWVAVWSCDGHLEGVIEPYPWP